MLLCVAGAILILVYNVSKGKFVDEGNQTIIQNINKTEITNIQPGQRNIYDLLTVVLIWVTVIIGLSVLTFLFLKYKPIGKLNVENTKEKCIIAALNNLKNLGYSIQLQKPKQSYRYYGGDDEKNPAWAFSFCLGNFNYVSDYLDSSQLICCCVDAKTLEVFNEQVGINFEDYKLELHDQRFGKLGVPNWPVKTETEPSLFGSVPKGSSLNVPIEEEE